MIESTMKEVRCRFATWTESDENLPFLKLAGKMLCLSASQIVVGFLRVFMTIGGCITYGLMKLADNLSKK